MPADRTSILTWLTDLVSDLVEDAIDKRELTQRIAAAPTLDAASFGAEVLTIGRVIGETVTTLPGFDRLSLPSSLSGETRAAASVVLALMLSVSGARVDWPSRPAARNARARISEAGDIALAAASSLAEDGADLYGWLSSVISSSVRVVSAIAANSVPVVRVETELSLPSTLIAYKLYGDASRADGVVSISRSSTPMLMPSAFDALAT
jgi:hypothetical protein